MLPKVIHYCWFGRKPLPESALKCIASWKKYLPEHEIIEWNEDNFDVNSIPYTAEAYSAGKYAFVSDYVRFWALYTYGGLYFDVDVELIGNINHIISKGNFMAYQCGMGIAPGLGLGLEAGNAFVGRVLEEYRTLHFLVEGRMMMARNVVNIVTDLLREEGIENVSEGIDRAAGINIYYPEYFSPLDYRTGILTITANTRAIHHYDASWKSPVQKLKEKIIRILGADMTTILVKIKNF